MKNGTLTTSRESLRRVGEKFHASEVHASSAILEKKTGEETIEKHKRSETFTSRNEETEK